MGQSFPTPSAAGTMILFVTDLATQTDTLRSCFSGDDPPSAPVDGQPWFETDTLTMYYWDGTSWIVYGSVIGADLDVDSNELLNARVENRASDVAPASGNVGLVYLHTGVKKLKIVVDSAVRDTVLSVSNADLWSIPLPLTSWTPDVTNPPTDPGAVGTTPALPVLLFDAINERLSRSVTLPRGFSEDASILLRLHYILNAAETLSDVADVVLDYRKQILDSADAADGASTQVTATESIGATSAAQYTYHKVDLPMVFNDATNPLTKNNQLIMAFGLNDITGARIAAMLFTGAELLSPCSPLGITEIA